MQHIRKLFFVPVGLPGMGKSTLAKNIKNTIERHLNKEVFDDASKQLSRDTDNQQLLDVDTLAMTTKLSDHELS